MLISTASSHVLLEDFPAEDLREFLKSILELKHSQFASSELLHILFLIPCLTDVCMCDWQWGYQIQESCFKDTSSSHLDFAFHPGGVGGRY